MMIFTSVDQFNNNSFAIAFSDELRRQIRRCSDVWSFMALCCNFNIKICKVINSGNKFEARWQISLAFKNAGVFLSF